MSVLAALRKSASNPAWLRSAIAGRAMRHPETAAEMRGLAKMLEEHDVTHAPLDLETSLILRRNVEKLPSQPRRELEGEQLRLPGFAEGGWNDVKRHIPQRVKMSGRDDSLSVTDPDYEQRATLRSAGEAVTQLASMLPGLGVVGKLGSAAWKAASPTVKTLATTIAPAVATGDPTWLGGPLTQMASYSPDAEASGLFRFGKDVILPYWTKAFHGTTKPDIVSDVLRGSSNKLEIDRMLGPHVALGPKVTEAFSVGPNYAYRTGSRVGDEGLWASTPIGEQPIVSGGNTLPLLIGGKFRDLPGDSGWGALQKELSLFAARDPEKYSRYIEHWLRGASHGWFEPQQAREVATRFAKGEPTLVRIDKSQIYPVDKRTPQTNLGFPIPTREMEVANFEDLVLKNPRKQTQLPKYQGSEDIAKDFRDALTDEGYSGVIYRNQSKKEVPSGADPTSLIITDPGSLRSVFGRLSPADVGKEGLGLARGGLVSLKGARYGS